MREAHIGLTRKFDQIAPDSFRMRKTLPSPPLVMREQMDRDIAPLNFVTRAAQRSDEMRGQIVAAASREDTNNLGQAS